MKRLAALLVGAALLGGAALTPGPQHALWPRLVGLTRIAPGVWADSPEAEAYMPVIQRAQARLQPFFGTKPAPDRIILCSRAPCAKRLGIFAAGLSYGERLVLIAPSGLTEPVITHELAHIATNRDLPLSAAWHPPFPMWFHEGLAVWLAPPDPRYVRPDSEAEALWIKQAITGRDWSAMVTAETYPEVYGGAGRLVEALEARIGREALITLVQQVQNGAAFETALAEAGG